MLSSLAKYHTQDCVAVEIFIHQIISCQNIYTSNNLPFKYHTTGFFVCLLCVTVVGNLFLAIVGYFHLWCMACQTVHNHQTRHQTLSYSFFFQLRTPFKQVLLFCTDQNITLRRQQQWIAWWRWQWKVQQRHDGNNGDGRHNSDGDSDGRRNGNAMATEGAIAMRRQRRQ